MTDIKRRSPVSFKSAPVQTETRGHWTVVLKYTDEGQGPHLIDLCHRPRWDVQDANLKQVQPWGITVPQKPGACTLQKGVLINRMNRTQAAVWHVAGNPVEAPAESCFTETTDATVFLALIGPQVFAIAEKLSAVDFQDPSRKSPFLLQGPFSHVPCQMVVLNGSGNESGILLTCSRGYARDMVDAILHAGAEFGLRPAGEATFSRWIQEQK
jgi:hypothetical protein